MLRAKSILLVPITLIVVIIDLVQFIGWVALSYICIGIILDGIINKPQYSVIFVKISINVVPVYAISSTLRSKWHACNCKIPFDWVILRKYGSVIALSHYSALFSYFSH